MKVAITTSEPTLDSPVDPRFAAAPYFVLVDLDSTGAAPGVSDAHHADCSLYENPAAKPGAGHGIIAARFVARLGVDAVISGDYCPHAFGALRSIDVALYAAQPGTAAHALEQLRQHTLPAGEPSPHHHQAHFQPHRPLSTVPGD